MLDVVIENSGVARWRVSPFSQILEEGRKKLCADDHAHEDQSASRRALHGAFVLCLHRVCRHRRQRSLSMPDRFMKFLCRQEAAQAAI